MAEHGRVPEGIRSSRTGRVPQWVVDEAMGLTVTPVPFRGPTSASGHLTGSQKQSAGRRGLHLLVALAFAGSLGAAALYLDQAPSGMPAVAPPEVAAPEPVGPVVGFEEAGGPLGSPPSGPVVAEGQGFRFLRHGDDGSAPVTWSPCRPIHYVTRPDNAPPGGEAWISAAVAKVSAATGLRFLSDGATTEGPSEDRSAYQPNRYGERWAPVLIVWATKSEVPDFGVDLVGEARPYGVGTPSGDATYVTGEVYLDPAKLGQIASQLGSAQAGAVVLHELGHLVGLAHTDGETEIMFPRGGAVVDLGTGDRAGLAALGGGPCQPDI